jgi:4-hydroxyphenylpyruvate dioxygenase
MGPFPHLAPKSVISGKNPAGTDGFEFAHPDPQVLRDCFARMGDVRTACHKTRAIELWQ